MGFIHEGYIYFYTLPQNQMHDKQYVGNDIIDFHIASDNYV